MKQLQNITIFFVCILFSCQPFDIVKVKNGRKLFGKKYSADSTLNGKLLTNYYDEDYKLFRDFATMSSYVYSKNVDLNSRRPFYDGTSTRDKFEPTEESEFNYLSSRWERFDGKIMFPATPINRKKIDGFAYDVWISKDTPLKAVIVMRGTDFGEKSDWGTNFRWVTKSINGKRWDQYDQVRDLVPNIISTLTERYGNNIKIFATGHSLGGGLAQHASYCSSKIIKVFAFHPSPVTAFYDVPKQERDKNKIDKTTYRIYEKGEALAVVRFPLSIFYFSTNINPKIIQLRYNMFKRTNLAREHKISIFAGELRNYELKK